MPLLKFAGYEVDAAAYRLGGTAIVTAAGALQNVTADAGLLTSGTLADERLSANVPLLNAAANQFTGTVGAASYKLGANVIITAGGVLQNVTASAGILTSGTLADARLSTNVPLLDAATNAFTGGLSAASYAVDGVTIVTNARVLQNVTVPAALVDGLSGATTDAGDLTAGTLADARLSANVPLLNAAANQFTGTVGAASYKLGANVIITAGGVLQNVTASAGILTSGTLADARLSTNVPLLDAATNAFTGAMTVGGNVTALAFFTSSSRAVKRHIRPLERSALELLRGVRVVRFAYRDDPPDAERVGFVAEDTDPLLSGPQRRGMDHANTIAMLIRAVQELDHRTRLA